MHLEKKAYERFAYYMIMELVEGRSCADAGYGGIVSVTDVAFIEGFRFLQKMLPLKCSVSCRS